MTYAGTCRQISSVHISALVVDERRGEFSEVDWFPDWAGPGFSWAYWKINSRTYLSLQLKMSIMGELSAINLPHI